jgi:hypothetical protein
MGLTHRWVVFLALSDPYMQERMRGMRHDIGIPVIKGEILERFSSA